MAEPSAETLPRRTEWPTLGLAVAIYGGFGLATWFHESLPWWLLLSLGGFLVAWHGSLQHEVVHGHPTSSDAVNELLVFPSLWLWLPFRLYRVSHLTHHRDENLTDPATDPESNYVSAETWAGLAPAPRAFYWILNTLAGRLLFGPAVCAWRVWSAEITRLARGDVSHLFPWTLHIAGSALVLVWVLWVCGMPLADYLLFFAYPGVSLTLMRSFLEHQAREKVGERSVIIEAEWPMALLYLNNNLHALHHAEPGTAWYRLPARFRQRRDELLALNGGYRYSGYAEVVARHLLWAKEPPVHGLTPQPISFALQPEHQAAS